MCQRYRVSSSVTADLLGKDAFPRVERHILETMATSGTTRVYDAGEFVVHASDACDACFVLLHGSARSFHRSPEGLEVESRLMKVGSLVGFAECLLGMAYLEGVQTMESSTVVRIPKRVILDALKHSHLLTHLLLHDASSRLAVALHSERLLAFHRIETRLANLLSTYVGSYGVPANDGIRIRIPLSQDDLANGLGVARRSITRTMKNWMRDGIIVKQGRHFVVCDPGRLARLGDAEALRAGTRLAPPPRPKPAPSLPIPSSFTLRT